MFEGFVGSAVYQDHVPGDRLNKRIVVPCGIGPATFQAILDTGAPYNVLDPELSEDVLASPDVERDRLEIVVLGRVWAGPVKRARYRLIAMSGRNVDVEGSFFVPRWVVEDGRDYEDRWNGPNFIGYSGTLERIRFAVDPSTSTWYFSPL